MATPVWAVLFLGGWMSAVVVAARTPEGRRRKWFVTLAWGASWAGLLAAWLSWLACGAWARFRSGTGEGDGW